MTSVERAVGGHALRARLGALSFPGRALVPYAVAFVLAFAAFHHGYENLKAQPMTGDEPSYLLDAFSMARDGDRDLSNQFSYQDPHPLTELFGGAVAFPHVIDRPGSGRITLHGAGLGFVVVPGVWIGDWRGDPVDWVRLELVLIDALAALALFAVVRRAAQLLRIRQIFAWVAWASAVLSLPLLSYADQLYPEVPALLCILLALNAAMRPRPGWPTLLAGSAAASYLPWLHIRFIPVCLGLLLALALRGLTTLQHPAQRPAHDLRAWLRGVPGELRGLAHTVRTRAGLAIAAAVALPGLASFVLMAVEFQRWYGSPAWTATGGGGDSAPSVVTSTWYPAVFGGLFGTDYGWVPWAPVAVLALAALGCLLVEAPRWTIYALLFAGVYQAELAFSGIATPGYAPPGRYEIVCIPLLAVPLMVALARIPVAWLAFIPLMLATLAITHQASERSGINLLTGSRGLPMAARLSSAFPDVAEAAAPTSFNATPPDLDGLVGGLTPDGKERVARPSAGPGFLVAGPRAPLAAGTYVARFLVTQTGGRGKRILVQLQVWALPGQTLATTSLSARDLPSGEPTAIDLRFTTPGGLGIETRAYVAGEATVAVGAVRARSLVGALAPRADRYPDGALMATWVLGLAFVAALLAHNLTLGRRAGGAAGTDVPEASGRTRRFG